MKIRIIRLFFGAAIGLVISILLLVLPITPVASALGGADIHVNTNADTYNGAGCSLRDAIQTANLGSNHGGCIRFLNLTSTDVILLPSDTYTLTLVGAGEDSDVTGDLDIQRSMIISATGAITPTVTADVNWRDRIFHIISGSTTIKHIAISGGYEILGSGGGGLRVESAASLSLNDAEVAGNQSFQDAISSAGGGIDNFGIATLSNVTLSANKVGADGGAISNAGSLTLNNTNVVDNSANGAGGGIYEYFTGAMTLTNATLSGNHSLLGFGGGGIYNTGGAVLLTGVTLNGNSAAAGSGGGIYNDFGAITLTNVTLSGNVANAAGGGLFNGSTISGGGTSALTNVTLYGNTAGLNGGIQVNRGTVTVKNTLVANNPGGNCGGVTDGGFNLSSDNNCGFGAGRDNINPMVAPLGSYGGPTQTHVLFSGSPALDFGTNTGCPSTDQRGKPRPVHVTCDVGAVERQTNDFPFSDYMPLIRK